MGFFIGSGVVVLLIAVAILVWGKEKMEGGYFANDVYITHPLRWLTVVLIIVAIIISFIIVGVKSEQNKAEVEANITAMQEEIDELKNLLEKTEDEELKKEIIKMIEEKMEAKTDYELKN